MIIHALDIHLDPENTKTLKPEDFGYENKKELLIPEKSCRTLESHIGLYVD